MPPDIYVQAHRVTVRGPLQWNGAAQSWDCRCHGGRYRPTGEVLCAPQTQALRRLRAEEVGQHEEQIR